MRAYCKLEILKFGATPMDKYRENYQNVRTLLISSYGNADIH